MFTAKELHLIAWTVARYPKLSRQELAATVCELLRWERPSGQLKTRECRDLLERLHQRGQLCLPEKCAGRPTGAATRTPEPPAPPRTPMTTALATLQPLRLVIAHTPAQHTEWRSLIAHHHYLGYRTPFGAHLRYLIQGGEPAQTLGALQYSSPAWRMRARDRWIGWNEPIRKQRLPHIVNQSRFLILPWVQVKNLASHVLALSARQILTDWTDTYHIRPLLLETLVDEQRYRGTCYRAANWLDVGSTTGRGRMDRTHHRHGHAPKRLFLYPLDKRAREKLTKPLP